MSDVQKETKPIPANTCSDCGDRGICCKWLPISPIGLSVDYYHFLIHRGVPVDAKQTFFLIPQTCTHLTAQGLCDDYENRPKLCRIWNGQKSIRGQPFWIPPGCTLARKK